MLTTTIVLSGKVVVEDHLFSWWVTDGASSRLTVSHPIHGTETRPLAETEPRAQAHTLAQALLAGKVRPTLGELADDRGAPTHDHEPEATVVLGEDYRRGIEDGFTGPRPGKQK